LKHNQRAKKTKNRHRAVPDRQTGQTPCSDPAITLVMAVADLIRQIGISEQTFYRWKKQYGGLQSE